jgi:hypothetical protein
VERTFSWLSENRRMSKDYERLPESSEAFIYVAMRAALCSGGWLAHETFQTVSLDGVLRSSRRVVAYSTMCWVKVAPGNSARRTKVCR